MTPDHGSVLKTVSGSAQLLCDTSKAQNQKVNQMNDLEPWVKQPPHLIKDELLRLAEAYRVKTERQINLVRAKMEIGSASVRAIIERNE